MSIVQRIENHNVLIANIIAVNRVLRSGTGVKNFTCADSQFYLRYPEWTAIRLWLTIVGKGGQELDGFEVVVQKTEILEQTFELSQISNGTGFKNDSPAPLAPNTSTQPNKFSIETLAVSFRKQDLKSPLTSPPESQELELYLWIELRGENALIRQK